MKPVARRTLLKTGLAAPGAATAAVLLPRAAQAAPAFSRTLATGLNYPWGIDFLPDGTGLVTERNSGRIVRVDPDGGSQSIGRVPGVYNDGGEGGLMGLRVSPNFANDRWLYAFMTTRTDNRIVRMRFNAPGLGAPQVLVAGMPRGTVHNGGGLWIVKGPSTTTLFASTGDTDRRELAQNRGSLAGKILRMDMLGRARPGNPFGNRIFSYGHRNPQGIVVAPDFSIWACEFGSNRRDELNRIRQGRNYGWPRVEGSDGPGGYTDPFTQWLPENCSPSGLAITGGRAYVGALRGQSLWAVDLAGAGAGNRVRYFEGRFGRIRGVAKHPDGSLWIGTSNGGGADRVIRITL